MSGRAAGAGPRHGERTARSGASRDRLEPVYTRVVKPLAALALRSRTYRLVPAVRSLLSLPAAEMRRVAFQRLRSMLVHARDTVPFHRERMRAAGFDPEAARSPEDLGSLPTMTQLHLREQANALLSEAYAHRPLVEYRTGGTTAAPVRFVQTRGSVARKDAASMVLRSWMGWRPGDRGAFLWGAVQDGPPPPKGVLGRVKARVRKFANRGLWLPVGEMTDGQMDRHIEALRRWRPRAIQGFPSSTDLLARRLLERGDRLFVPIVLLSAEPTLPEQRSRIAKALGAEVFTFYGARECGWIASECAAEHRLHVNTAGIFLEESPDGRLLVTDLENRAMPLVRYEVGDRGALDPEPCPCGDPRPVIARIDGRLVDMFTLPSGRRVPGLLPDGHGRALRMEGVFEAQLVQETASTLLIRWVPGPNFTPQYLAEFQARLNDLFYGELKITLEQTDRIRPGPSGKVRWCISHVTVPP